MVEAKESYVGLVRDVALGGAAARAAETAICREFAPRIRLYGLRHLRDEDRAAELVQVVLIAVIEALRAARVTEPEHLDRFVLGTCRNTVHRMRDDAARVAVHAPEDIDLGVVDPKTEHVDVEALFRCVAALDERNRAVLFLTFQEDRSADEIAATLATTTANVRVLRHRAVARVRSCLEAKGAA